MSTTFQKIPGPFIRDHATNQLTEEFSSPELAALKDAEWEWTEKVDGTNVRVIWDGYRVTFGGRTDNAHLPIPLFEWLTATFGGPEKEQLFEQKFGDTPAVLYGEGYGPKIQSGGKYRDDISVVFYDVKVARFWLLRNNVVDVTSYFGVDVVPLVFTGTLTDAIALVKSGVESRWGGPDGLAGSRDYHTAEGIVGVTAHGLLDRSGNRIMVKLKHRDFPIR